MCPESCDEDVDDDSDKDQGSGRVVKLVEAPTAFPSLRFSRAVEEKQMMVWGWGDDSLGLPTMAPQRSGVGGHCAEMPSPSLTTWGVHVVLNRTILKLTLGLLRVGNACSRNAARISEHSHLAGIVLATGWDAEEVGQGACLHCVVVTWALEGAQG